MNTESIKQEITCLSCYRLTILNGKYYCPYFDIKTCPCGYNVTLPQELREKQVCTPITSTYPTTKRRRKNNRDWSAIHNDIVRLIAVGYSLYSIAHQLNVPPSSLWVYVKNSIANGTMKGIQEQ